MRVSLTQHARRANAATEDEIVVPVNQDESLKATYGRPLEQVRSPSPQLLL